MIHIVAENFLAIFSILTGIEDVLMPELIHVKRRRRDGNFRALARESKKKSSVFEFHLRGLVGTPTQTVHDFQSNRVQVQMGYMSLRQ